jgi:hypothetical protein
MTKEGVGDGKRAQPSLEIKISKIEGAAFLVA